MKKGKKGKHLRNQQEQIAAEIGSLIRDLFPTTHTNSDVIDVSIGTRFLQNSDAFKEQLKRYKKLLKEFEEKAV